MTLSTPSIDFSDGKIVCMHIPHEFQAAGEALESELLQTAQRQGKKAFVAQAAGFETGACGLKPTESSEGWLSRISGISKSEAKGIISGLGVYVAEKVAWNAGTPRTLLGIAATLIKQPDVIIYSERGLDPEGCLTVHRFVTSKCKHLCIVHVSYPSVYGNGTPHPRYCPPNAQCIELTGRS